MLIVFRADASLAIGSGHIMRCMTLAKLLREKGHNCEFVCRDHTGHLKSFIEREGFPVCLITIDPNSRDDFHTEIDDKVDRWLGASWIIDSKQTRQCIGDRKPDWLIVDHYAIDYEWHRELRLVAKQIMVIDDLANRQFDCDVLLDQNLGRTESHYKDLVPSKCIKLTGPKYALLRNEFAEYRKASLARRTHPNLNRVLISLGGVDIDNVTTDVIDALENSELPSSVELDIILGASAPHVEKVRECAARSRFLTTISISVDNMAERMLMADLAIGAAGGSAWERCCLGLPSIIIVLADNQKPGALELSERNIAIVLLEKKCINRFIPMIMKDLMTTGALNKLSEAARTIIDGRGATRVVETLMRECCND